MSSPVVSVVMITYNHSQFVEEAIISILNQQCSFEFELVISDDCSKDDTKSKIQKLIDEHNKGSIIRFFPQSQNLGIMKNFSFSLLQAKGKYIAICEGDDFWTESKKLQKQFEILESHPECVLSFHNAEILYQNTQNRKPFSQYFQTIYSASDLFDQWLIPTASSFFRNLLPKQLPDFLTSGTHGDLALFLLLGEFGNFYYSNEIMSTYRINDVGITQSAFKGIQHNIDHIAQLQKMRNYFKNKYEQKLIERISNYQLSLALLYSKAKDKKQSKYFLKIALRNNRSLFWNKSKTILRICLNNLFLA